MVTEIDQDIDRILEKRHHQDGDFWATPDGKIYVGNPFSTLSCLLMLHELGVDRSHEAVQGALDLVLDACRDDGRIKLGPRTPRYPCYTGEAARVLCRYGFAEDPRVDRVVSYFLESAHERGGWRCSFSRFGKGPETEWANPGATLYILDTLRFKDTGNEIVDAAVEFLLMHWKTREPLGPCHWGIGTQFLQVEFPFLRYNLFFYVYVLSFYEQARADERFREALEVLRGKLDDDGKVVVERPHRRLKGLHFCRKGEPSDLATVRLDELEGNLDVPGPLPRRPLGRH